MHITPAQTSKTWLEGVDWFNRIYILNNPRNPDRNCHSTNFLYTRTSFNFNSTSIYFNQTTHNKHKLKKRVNRLKLEEILKGSNLACIQRNFFPRSFTVFNDFLRSIMWNLEEFVWKTPYTLHLYGLAKFECKGFYWFNKTYILNNPRYTDRSYHCTNVAVK